MSPLDLRAEFPAALQTGAFVVCERCRHCSRRPGEAPDGYCDRYQTETWRRVPFDCPEFQRRPRAASHHTTE